MPETISAKQTMKDYDHVVMLMGENWSGWMARYQSEVLGTEFVVTCQRYGKPLGAFHFHTPEEVEEFIDDMDGERELPAYE